MSQGPTPEDAARSILKQFKNSGASAGTIIMRGAVDSKALNDGLNNAELVSGLQYGVQNGWFDMSNPSFVKLTAIGFGQY
jgi:hypothetical protein